MRDSTEPHDWRAVVDARLAEIAAQFGAISLALGQAMSDATLAPGKRFRAMLMLLGGDATGGTSPALIDAACAVELVHTASLVFDDLPCMDDAKTRRGRSTTHIAHGEGRAILAGISLVTEAMRLLATARDTDATTRIELVASLARAVGPLGLSAGQDLDLHAPKTAASVELEQDLKTGALFVAGFEMLALVQNLGPEESCRLAQLGQQLGRAFQSYDDLLDVEAAADSLDKDRMRDAQAPGPARGLLAVEDLATARARYLAQKAEVDSILNRCAFDTTALGLLISRVLPVGQLWLQDDVVSAS